MSWRSFDVNIACHDGFSLTRLQPALESLDSVLGRMQLIPHTNITAVVDYAHTPDALENILLTLSTTARQSGSKLIVVFGCGGDRDQYKRPLMAAVVDKQNAGDAAAPVGAVRGLARRDAS